MAANSISFFSRTIRKKVWDVAPSQISAEWGAQRIKGVSLSKTIAGTVKSMLKKNCGNFAQKETETSLIQQFLYPKYGPGSLWGEVARQVRAMGGLDLHEPGYQSYQYARGHYQNVTTLNSQTGQTATWKGEYVLSTMPAKEPIADIGKRVPPILRENEILLRQQITICSFSFSGSRSNILSIKELRRTKT